MTITILKRNLVAVVSMAAAMVLAMSLMIADAAQAEGYGKQKVVYHINYPGGPEDKKYKGALRNIQNHINAVGAENLELKVVMHGNGVGMVMNAKESDALQTAIGSLKGQNVSFHVCANTLRGREISYENDLYDTWEQDIVPSGVAEIAHLQQQGYAYIKP